MKLQLWLAIFAVLFLTANCQCDTDVADAIDELPILESPDDDTEINCLCSHIDSNQGDYSDDLSDTDTKNEICQKCTSASFCAADTGSSASTGVESLKFTACGSGATAGYTINDGTNCIVQDSFNKCYNYMGELEASVNTQTVPQYGDITSDCGTSTVTKTLNGNADTAALELVIEYAQWSPFEWLNFNAGSAPISDCSFARSLTSSSNCSFGSEDTGCDGVTDLNQWGQSVQTVNQGFADDSNLQAWSFYLDQSQNKGRLYLPIADIVSSNSQYCRQMTEGGEVQSNAQSFYYQCYFAEQVTIWGEAQLIYTFYVQLQVNRETQATESLQVKKTLVEGQCCKNSLGVESHLWFCDENKNGNDGGACTKDKSLTEVARLADFYIRWELNEASTTQPNTSTLKPLVSLYPDTVSIGPFIADFTIDNNWEGVTVGGVSLIKLKSNIAFAASITVAGKIYDINDHQPGPYDGSNDTRPHTCFPVNGVPPTAPSANCAVTASGSGNRRILQTAQQKKDMGTPNSQVQVSAAINIKDENNQNNNNTNKKSDDDDDNTVLIAVLVSLAVVLVIGGVIGGIFYCKSKNAKQAKYETNEVKQTI